MTTFRLPHYFAPHEKNMTLAINRSLAAKKDNHEAGTSALEREIDQKIYASYGLMSEGIVIVEGTGK
jgi:hypothetical protein